MNEIRTDFQKLHQCDFWDFFAWIESASEPVQSPMQPYVPGNTDAQSS